jgi:hypothetical protein
MTALWFNRQYQSDRDRRGALYAGDILVYDRLESVLRYVAFTRDLIEKALAPHDPQRVHEELTPAELAPLLGKLKPAFTHHPEGKRLVAGILEELGVDLEDTYLDVPKMRSAYRTGHLTKGIAFAFGAHRDTWYGAPQAQLNWWLPIYSLTPDNTVSFYPGYFDVAATNDSADFNYYRRNVERQDVTKFIESDPRVQPSASDIGASVPDLRPLPAVGGLLVFSGAQLHATVTGPESMARYSVDFRSVSRADVEHDRGARNVDSKCVGTALRDFRRSTDGAELPEELARKLDPIGPREGEVAVFKPPS